MIRMNITLPDGVAKEPGKVKNKSRFIAEAVSYKFQLQEKQRLHRQLIEGYKAQSTEDLRQAREWDAALGDGLE